MIEAEKIVYLTEKQAQFLDHLLWKESQAKRKRGLHFVDTDYEKSIYPLWGSALFSHYHRSIYPTVKKYGLRKNGCKRRGENGGRRIERQNNK